MNPKLILAGIFLGLAFGVWFYRDMYLDTKSEFDAFVANTKAAGKLANTIRLKKEADDEERIKAAERAANIALRKLRDYQSTPRGPVPGSPQTANTDTICWSTDRFNQGLRELEGILIAGQEAVIDRATLLQAWPR